MENRIYIGEALHFTGAEFLGIQGGSAVLNVKSYQNYYSGAFEIKTLYVPLGGIAKIQCRHQTLGLDFLVTYEHSGMGGKHLFTESSLSNPDDLLAQAKAMLDPNNTLWNHIEKEKLLEYVVILKDIAGTACNPKPLISSYLNAEDFA